MVPQKPELGVWLVAGEAVADKSVQADAFLCGGQGKFSVQRLWDAYVELARKVPFGDRLGNRGAVCCQIRNDVGDEVDETFERLGLVGVKP